MATFESACKVVRFEFEENMLNSESFETLAELAQSNKKLKKMIDAAQSSKLVSSQDIKTLKRGDMTIDTHNLHSRLSMMSPTNQQ